MKAHLLHPDLDFELEARLPPAHEALVEDVGLADVFAAMAAGDRDLHDIARTVVLAGLDAPDDIRYRQDVLRDCLEHREVPRDLYAMAVAAIEGERQAWRIYTRDPELALNMSIRTLEHLLPILRRLRGLAEGSGSELRSEGFRRFFEMLRTELDDAYLAGLEEHVELLRFRGGVSLNGGLGRLNMGTGFALLRPARAGLRSLLRRGGNRRTYTIEVPARDDAGMQALADLRARGINLVANAASQAVDHVMSFFAMVRFEVGFYLAGLNLHDRLTALGEAVCFPEPHPGGTRVARARGLVDIGLSLRSGAPSIGSDLDADGRSLVFITGANQGGKSTFLRALGLAQVLMQSGLFVGAASFAAEVRLPVLSHFKRREDAAMASGKLDEELKRFSELVDAIGSRAGDPGPPVVRAGPRALLLFNESFAATNEREGADIAEEIVRALTEAGVTVFFVTHSYELARRFMGGQEVLFLRAERLPDGQRTYRQVPGEPLRTSYGEDLFRRIFAAADRAG